MTGSGNAKRPFHFGPFPLERLPRSDSNPLYAGTDSPGLPAWQSSTAPLSAVLDIYRELFEDHRDGEVAAAVAPVPENLERRVIDIKGAAYFLDASQVGIGPLDGCWTTAPPRPGLEHGIAIAVEHPRAPEADNPAAHWTRDCSHEIARLHALEIAICVADHCRRMGFEALAFDGRDETLQLRSVLLASGLGVEDAGCVQLPFLGTDFAVAVVATAYPLQHDAPLAPGAARRSGPGYWLGLGGARSGFERWRRMRRQTHMSAYPMEQVRRVDRPTTLILDDEVPRVPKRAAFFERALRGDLGEKAARERWRFAYKHPLAASMVNLIRAMVPLQDGRVTDPPTHDGDDAAANTRALKSLSYMLGADLTGVCEIPSYAWFSHREDGTPVEPYHRYAVVMLIDQGYQTMEGASGDDWISGAQSMRSYMRGARIAGVMAELLRKLGFPARAQTNVDSDLLHIPLVLLAGLGEMSRIGELVLNPFVGPRFKSVVLTTDMPLEVDKPVDFGLQDFCSKCFKCARECPCDAIPHGDKVMFNGYEIWKPDVERCTRYRLTNQRGLGCGRCMKACPLNKVVTWDGPLLTRVASWLGVNALWLKPLLAPIAIRLDDWLGHGVRNPVKKWWLDLEIVDGVCVEPRGTNARDLSPADRLAAVKQKIAYYHADMMPAPNAGDEPHAVERRQGLAAAAKLETPAEARARRAARAAVPLHYRPRISKPSSAD